MLEKTYAVMLSLLFLTTFVAVFFTPGTVDATYGLLDENTGESNILYSSYLGGNGYDELKSTVQDEFGNIYITGLTTSTDLPVSIGAFQTTNSGGYDSFVIKFDPSGKNILYSTYIGGGSDDYVVAIALDSQNNAYIAGYTLSADFPTTNGALDTTYNGGYCPFVVKLNQVGSSIIYSTFINGSSNSGYDEDIGHGNLIAVDDQGCAFVTGYTSSPDFITTPGSFDTTHNGGKDAFVIKLDQSGSSILYSTFIGGSNNDYGNALVIDSLGNAYISGGTHSANFPVTSGSFDTTHNGGRDAFILKLNQTGSSVLYSTFIGGSSNEYCHSIALDDQGCVYITGQTYSVNFQTTFGAYDRTHNGGISDVFVVKIYASGSICYSTFIGGSGNEASGMIAVDAQGNAYVAGVSDSTNYPVTSGAYADDSIGGLNLIISCLNPTGSTLIYSTYLGCNVYYTHYIALDADNNAIIIGNTDSSIFPTSSDAFDSTYSGNMDGYIVKFFFARLPGTPTNVQIIAGNMEIALSWNAPVYLWGPQIDYYIIYQDGIDVGRVNGTSTTITGLTNGQTYSIAIAAHNSDGIGSQSPTQIAVPATVPNAPEDFIAAPSDRQVSLSWSTPINDGGASIDYYIIYQDNIDVKHISATSATISGLNNGQSYLFAISAHNAMGVGDKTDSRSVIPFTLPQQPIDFVVEPGDESALLSWKAPTDSGTSTIDYFVVYMNGSDIKHVTTNATEIFGMVNGVSYAFEIAAHSIFGTGVYSSTEYCIPYGVPGSINELRVLPGNGSALLSWDEPFDNGNTIQYYTIIANGQVIDTTTSTSINLLGLTNGQTYLFTVSASNDAGSSQNNVEISAIPIGDPLTPIIGEGSNLMGITIAWSVDEALANPTDNIALYYSVDGVSWIFLSSLSGTNGKIDVSEVTSSDLTSTYYFKIVATNPIGSSESVIFKKEYYNVSLIAEIIAIAAVLTVITFLAVIIHLKNKRKKTNEKTKELIEQAKELGIDVSDIESQVGTQEKKGK